jgi:hypothetical protein
VDPTIWALLAADSIKSGELADEQQLGHQAWRLTASNGELPGWSTWMIRLEHMSSDFMRFQVDDIIKCIKR